MVKDSLSASFVLNFKTRLLKNSQTRWWSLIIWDYMSAARVGKIHFTNGFMDSKYYIDILKEIVLKSAESLGHKRRLRILPGQRPQAQVLD